MRPANITGIEINFYNPIMVLLLLLTLSISSSAGDNMAFPGAMGWASESKGPYETTNTPEILKVTSLDGGTGTGTFRWALAQNTPRVIVFEVGGVIDLEWETVQVTNPYIWIAGQTAPSPGITIIKGEIEISTHDVIIQHISIRPGEHPSNPSSNQLWGLRVRELGGRNSQDIIIDHCSFTWATIINTGIHGANVADENWNNPPKRVTFSNSIISEGITGTNTGRGMFVSYGPTDIAIIRNLFSYNQHRNPLIAGAQGVLVNNLISGWRYTAAYSWDVNHTEFSIVGNYAVHLRVEGDPDFGWRGLYNWRAEEDSEIYFQDNISLDEDWETPLPIYSWRSGGGDGEFIILDNPIHWHESIEIIPAEDTPTHIAVNVGARPWDRDLIDERIVEEAMNGTGSLPTSDTWGPFPDYEPTYREFNPDEWDLRYMIPHSGYWEAPKLNSPENNAVDVGQSPTFQWSADDYLTHFTFQLATDEEFSEIVVDETDITGSSYTINNLEGSTAYYWRVRGHNATGPSQWSEIRQFHTDNVPNVPMLLSPENGSASVSDSALLEWDTSDNAESYSVQVSVDSNFSNIVAEEDDVAQTEYEVTNLETPATYYWRIRAHNSSGSSAWSDAWEFLLETEPETGSLEIHLNSGWNQISSYIAPVNPAIENVFSGIEENLVLVKNDNSGIYWPEIEINEIGEWNPLLGYQLYMEDGDILEFAGTQLLPEQNPIDLQQGWNQIAYLRTTPLSVEEALSDIDIEIEVVSNNAGDVYWPEYDINSLVTMEPGQGYKISVTEDVTLTYPANDEQEPAQKIAEKLVAQSSSERSNRPRHYNVAFGNTGDFAILLLLSPDLADGDEVGVRSPSNELVGSGVAQNGKALVTVWGRNPVLDGGQNIHGAVNGDALRLTQWSMHEEREYPVTITQVRDQTHHQFPGSLLRYQSDAVWIVDIEALNEVPRRYTLEQNYPNPFNPTTTIRYGIPEPVRVRLEVYNTIGQRIKVLVDEEKPAGFHQVIFDANDLSSGVYFYRLQAGHYTTMKRAVLIR